MRKVVYRDILGNNPRKHEVSVEERFSHPDRSITKKWVCKYFVEEKYFGKKKDDLRDWICSKKESSRKKNCHILRQCDTKTGENKIICKVLGDFFVIVGKMAYKIVYVNEVKINIKTARKVK